MNSALYRARWTRLSFEEKAAIADARIRQESDPEFSQIQRALQANRERLIRLKAKRDAVIAYILKRRAAA